MADEVKVEEGWAFPRSTGACHYFGKDRRSLCGNWMWLGSMEADDGVVRQSDCKKCRAKLAKLKAKAEG